MTDSEHEAEVRAMLQRRAGDVHPSPDAWEAISARLDGTVEAAVLPFDRARTGGRRRAVGAAAAAAVAAATLGGAALLGSGPTSLVADAPEEDPVTTVAPVPVPSGTPIPAVWPVSTVEALESMVELDQFLLDPAETATTYLVERLAPPNESIAVELGELQLGELEQGDARSGSFRYTTEGGLGGEVLLRRLGGEGTPWYVVAASNELLVFFPEVVDGQVVLAVTAEVEGTVQHVVTDASGEELATGEAAAGARETLTLATLDQEGALVTRARLVEDGRLVSFLEVWAEPIPSDGGTRPDRGPSASTSSTTTPIEAGAGVGETTVVLEADGLGFLGAGDDTTVSRLGFGSSQDDVVAAVSAALGEPVDAGTNEECGIGPAEVVRFPDGFTLTFHDGALVGWAVSGPAPRTAAGVGVGSTVAEVQEAYEGFTVVESTLGWELAGEDLFGVVSGPADGDVVEDLFGGVNCIFR